MVELRLGVISESLTMWPFYVANELGFFTRSEVSVVRVATQSSRQHIADLFDHRIDIGHQLIDHVVRARSQGRDLVAFLAIDHPVAHLMVDPSVDSYTALKNRAVGVDGVSTGYALLLRHMLAANGLVPDIDLDLVPIGGTHLRFAALCEGRIAATLLEAPGCFIARDLGFKELGTSTQFFPDYQGTVEAAQSNWEQDHREALVRYASAYLRGLEWLHTPRNRGFAVQILANRLGISISVASSCYVEQVEGHRYNDRARLTEKDLRATSLLMDSELQGDSIPYVSLWDASLLSKAELELASAGRGYSGVK